MIGLSCNTMKHDHATKADMHTCSVMLVYCAHLCRSLNYWLVSTLTSSVPESLSLAKYVWLRFSTTLQWVQVDLNGWYKSAACICYLIVVCLCVYAKQLVHCACVCMWMCSWPYVNVCMTSSALLCLVKVSESEGGVTSIQTQTYNMDFVHIYCICPIT